nr:hypothetical protein BHI3_06380 [Bacteriovorax sp. HI3]
MKLFILTLLFSQTLYGQTLSNKRSELIDVYASNLDGIWSLSENVPTDFYLSSLGVSLLKGSRSSDPVLNARLDRASASLLYMAAETSLLMGSEQFKNLANCNGVYEKYKKVITDKINDPENMCPTSMIEHGVCVNTNFLCYSKLVNYRDHFEHMTNFTLSSMMNTEEIVSPMARDALSLGLESSLNGIQFGCEKGFSPWANRVGQEFGKSCGMLIKDTISEHIFLQDMPAICRNKDKFPRLPLMFASTGRAEGTGLYCEDSLFQGISISRPQSLRIKKLFLISSQLRAFYWMQMAEEIFERTKTISADIKKGQPTASLVYSFSGDALCVSPMRNKECVIFGSSFLNSYKAKPPLSALSMAYESAAAVGNLYNSKKPLQAGEFKALERLSNDLENHRNNALSLKLTVQGLIEKSGVRFNYFTESNSL